MRSAGIRLVGRADALVKAFRAPRTELGDVDADTVASLVAAAADIALVLDPSGVIRDYAVHNDELLSELSIEAAWVGRPWAATVTVESRPKVEALLREATRTSNPRWRHLNHPSARGVDVPILYSAIQVGSDGRLVAFGRDLRAMSELQQRLVDAQQSMERDYARMRHAETRYRLLFQMSSEAVLILDGLTQKVLAANPTAGALCGEVGRRLIGAVFTSLFTPDSVQPMQTLLAAVRAAGRADDVRARLALATEQGGTREIAVSATLLREEAASFFLVRLVAQDGAAAAARLPEVKAKLLKLAELAPDGFVVTETDGRVITANQAFLEMVQLPSEDRARGESLDRWIGRPGVDVDVLTANLRQRGTIRLFATTLRAEYGGTIDVEVSATAIPDDGRPCLGFAVRNVGHRLSVESRATSLPRSVEQLTELIGRVSLKDLVRESTDMIERMYIEAALKLTDDNRASAAEMLGLSRQSLYVKLRRYGLGDLATEGEG